MDQAAAAARLSSLVAPADAPTLTSDQLGDLLELAKRPDAAGLAPTDPAWEPTWDLYAAAAEGWTWKAARVAGEATFSADGASVSKGDLHKACLAMAEHYRAQAGARGAGLGSVTLASSARRYPGRLHSSGVANL